MIINGVKIFTMTDTYGVIENGYVKIENGKITDVGAGEQTDDENVIYETGWLFPGFIDGHTHIGIAEDSLGFEGWGSWTTCSVKWRGGRSTCRWGG